MLHVTTFYVVVCVCVSLSLKGPRGGRAKSKNSVGTPLFQGKEQECETDV